METQPNQEWAEEPLEIHETEQQRRKLTPRGYIPHIEKDNLVMKYEFTDAELHEIDFFTQEEIETLDGDTREQISLNRAKAILERSPREPMFGDSEGQFSFGQSV